MGEAKKEAKEITLAIQEHFRRLRLPSSESMDFKFDVQANPDDVVESLSQEPNIEAVRSGKTSVMVFATRSFQDGQRLSAERVFDEDGDADQEAAASWQEYFPKGMLWAVFTSETLYEGTPYRVVYSAQKLLREGLPTWERGKFEKLLIAHDRREAEKAAGIPQPFEPEPQGLNYAPLSEEVKNQAFDKEEKMSPNLEAVPRDGTGAVLGEGSNLHEALNDMQKIEELWGQLEDDEETESKFYIRILDNLDNSGPRVRHLMREKGFGDKLEDSPEPGFTGDLLWYLAEDEATREALLETWKQVFDEHDALNSLKKVILGRPFK